MNTAESDRAVEAARAVAAEGKLPVYELGRHEPRAWLDGGGRLHPEGPHPKILFADVPIMVHLTNGYSLAPINTDEYGEQEDGHRTGPAKDCFWCFDK